MADLDPTKYVVAWIAPLEIEARAALHMLDERHQGRFPVGRGDDYVYHAGVMGGHNIIIATLPAGQKYGTGSAAALASQLKKFFPNLWFALLVGVAAGLPDLSRDPVRDIRLGDVLVSLPDGESAGLVTYDLGKETENGFQPLKRGQVLATTEPIVRSAIGAIKIEAPNDSDKILPYYEKVHGKKHAAGIFSDPGQDLDVLYFLHDDGSEKIASRGRRPDSERTRIWYGPIGSGDKLWKNSRKKNELRDKYGLIGLEMEAAGIMDQIPVGVIRGVCDYGDGHKDKIWQPFAAATAASYARALLDEIRPRVLPQRKVIQAQLRMDGTFRQTALPQYDLEAKECLSNLFITDPLDDKKVLKRKKGDRAAGTCEWILGTEDLTAWLGSGHDQDSVSHANQVLWLHGNPGTGKSTLAIYLTDALSNKFSAGEGHTLAYFFCDSAFDTRRTATSVIRGLLWQLVEQHPQLLNYVLPKYNERKTKLFESFDTLWAILLAAAADRNTGRKYCIIDALDECDDASQKTLLHQLRETFHSPNPPPNVRILVTSRPYPEIRKYLEKFSHKDLASFPDVKHDIDQCIKEKVAELKYTKKIKARVTELLREKAEGTFLWVGIACNELENTPSKDAISCLEAMPTSLYSLYRKLFSAAVEKETEKGTIRLILGIVAVSQRPLHLLELSEACRLSEDEDDIETRTQFMRDYIESCRLMVVVQNEKVLLLHQSVKDYLVKGGEQPRISEHEAHAELAYRCLGHIMGQFHNPKKAQGSFSSYAIAEWPNHARMAESRFVITAAQAEFFNETSPVREFWLAEYRACFVFDIPVQFSVLHVAARWGIPAIAKHVSHSYNRLGAADRLIDHKDASGDTALDCAIREGYVKVIPILLVLGLAITRKSMVLAAENLKHGKELIKLLLNQREKDITITEDVIKTAAGNTGSGKEVMALLLDRRGSEIAITEDVVNTAAENWENGKEVMMLLLQQQEEQISISGEAVLIISGRFDAKIMKLLLQQQGSKITMTEEVVKTVAGNREFGKQVMAFLLEQRGGEIAVTEEVVKAAAGNDMTGKEVMALLLEQRRGEIIITEDVMIAAAGNSGNRQEMVALRLEQIQMQSIFALSIARALSGTWMFGADAMALGCITFRETEEKAAAGNESNGGEVMTLLLEQRGSEIPITEEVVKAAAGNWGNGRDMIALLVKHRGREFTISEKVMVAAAGNCGQGKQVMALLLQLLEQRGSEIAVTAEVIKATQQNWKCGKEVMALLRDHYNRGACKGCDGK